MIQPFTLREVNGLYNVNELGKMYTTGNIKALCMDGIGKKEISV